FMTGVEFGGNRGKAHRQILDAAVGQRLLKLFGEVSAPDETGAGQTDVEISQDAAHRQPARPFLQPFHLARGVATANHRADRGADNDVRYNAVRGQRPQHTDMRKAARSAAAECEPDARTCEGWLNRRGGGFRRAVAVARAPE